MKVIRYKNYGCTMTGPDEDSVWENKFYWSFYELSNGEIITLHCTENWKNNKFIDSGFDYNYAKQELINGKIINYTFGEAMPEDEEGMSKEFFEWFESQPPHHKIKNYKLPNDEEISCVKEFYDTHIEKNIKSKD